MFTTRILAAICESGLEIVMSALLTARRTYADFETRRKLGWDTSVRFIIVG